MKTLNGNNRQLPAQSNIQRRPNILLVDDDPIFRALLEKAAASRNISVTACASLKEVCGMSQPHIFDIAIVDYFLDGLKETLRGTDIAALTPSTPTLLISHSNYSVDDNTPWPSSIRKFLNKKAGVKHILDSAIQIFQNRFRAE